MISRGNEQDLLTTKLQSRRAIASQAGKQITYVRSAQPLARQCHLVHTISCMRLVIIVLLMLGAARTVPLLSSRRHDPAAASRPWIVDLVEYDFYFNFNIDEPLPQSPGR